MATLNSDDDDAGRTRIISPHQKRRPGSTGRHPALTEDVIKALQQTTPPEPEKSKRGWLTWFRRLFHA